MLGSVANGTPYTTTHVQPIVKICYIKFTIEYGDPHYGTFGNLVYISLLEPNVILNTLSQTPSVFKQYSVIALLVVIPRIVLFATSVRFPIRTTWHDC
jgi:hypothetical protein